MDKSGTVSQKLISSKEVLEKTGISRATLNNYIKKRIIPKPIIKKPDNSEKNIKSLGYFPDKILESIDKVKMLKRKGHTMAEIVSILSDPSISGQYDEKQTQQLLRDDELGPCDMYPEQAYKEKLKLSFDGISDPAYLLNYDFEIEWINRKAEDQILVQRIEPIQNKVRTNIFKLFFNWEFHSRVRNWKDLVTFHMAFAKFKYSKTWLVRFYNGISQREQNVLGDIYDSISVSPCQTISSTHISLLIGDGSIDKYCIYSIVFNEGILFIYNPSGKAFGGLC